jgi:lipoprotein-releasing system ATP-binding protein
MRIEVSNLHKTYQKNLETARREVLKGLDLKVDSGEKVAIMGPSGSGKTTLLNLIGSLDMADKGKIMLDGLDLAALSPGEILDLRNRQIGFVFQFHHLLPQCTLWENVLLPTLARKGDKTEVPGRAGELLKLLGIWECRHNKPAELSGGECQRAAVARALINRPKILLADEPTGSLDEKNASTLIGLLLEINSQMDITIMIATHSMDIACQMDKIYKIKDGKLEVFPDLAKQNSPSKFLL